jgi:integrase
LPLKTNKVNSLAWMASDLINNNFDETLDRYRRESVKPDPNALNSNINPELTIVRVWDEYVAYKRPMVAPSTIAKDYAAVSKYIGSPSIPQNLHEGTGVAVRDYLLSNTTPCTTKRVLVNLSACFRWAIGSRLVTENPFTGMSANVNIPKSQKDELADIDPFSSDERDSILDFLKNREESYGSSFVEFLFRTGCRHSEAIGLQWKHISDDFKKITFEQAVTFSENGLGLKSGLKTQSRRVFPCGKVLSEFLKSIAPEKIDRDDFIFKSPKGKFIDLNNFSRRVWHPCLKELNIRPRKFYQTRHTFITFCINSGVNAADVAKLVGNSAEIIYKHYMGGSRDLIAPDI